MLIYLFLLAAIAFVFELPLTAQVTSLQPDFALNGAGENVDSIAFWEGDGAEEGLLLVTAKDNQLVEVWPFPFAADNEADPIRHDSFADSQVNGIVVDQTNDLLYISISQPSSTASVFSLPNGRFVRSLLNNVPLGDEPGIELYQEENGRSWAYVTGDATQMVYTQDTTSGETVAVRDVGRELETILADEYHQTVYIPDENGRSGIYAYTPELERVQRNGRLRFGENVFQADAEGMILYPCQSNGQDNGTGFIVTSDQRKPATDFEFFDRISWEHVGTLRLEGVGNTDGIASTQRPFPSYPLGLFAAVNDDTETVGIGWDKVLAAMGLHCGSETVPTPKQKVVNPIFDHPFPTWTLVLIIIVSAGTLALLFRWRWLPVKPMSNKSGRKKNMK